MPGRKFVCITEMIVRTVILSNPSEGIRIVDERRKSGGKKTKRETGEELQRSACVRKSDRRICKPLAI